MARPRVFVSSTYYDMKHLRSSLENFIESIGYEPILSEKGDIAYAPDIPLDEACYREVRNADIFVIIIGGRYGSEKSEGKSTLPKGFYDRYDSITKQEYRSAVFQDIPIYILIERAVYADFENYLRNKDNKTFNYAHVDSVNIFNLIEEILAQRLNNPVQQFDRYSEIEAWLREQWAGLFRDFINRVTNQQQITSLSAKINELAEINITLKRYLEEVMSKVAPKESGRLIRSESKRLEEAQQLSVVRVCDLANYVEDFHGMPIEAFRNALMESKSFKELVEKVLKNIPEGDGRSALYEYIKRYEDLHFADINRLRLALGLSEYALNEDGTPGASSVKRVSIKQPIASKKRTSKSS